MKFDFKFTGKNQDAPEDVRERTEQKIRKLEKLLPRDAEITVTYSVNRQDNRIEVSVPLPKRILRAQVTSSSMYNAIDEVVDVLEKQLLKYKHRLKDRSRRDAAFSEELSQMGGDSDESDAADEVVIMKTKRFPLKPMDAEEACMEMELLGHSFYVFRNGRTDEVNVVYKRQDGTFGLIEPEY
ncbi:MAG: ribosome-associated translation inhibitor RaiA [Defluviitaleaceae bacterium]|nr:ribosome-associated translation inhibitor RaiA [Defluviitaleaceae bacterium]